MAKEIEYCGITVVISDYKEQHYFDNQRAWVGECLPIDPLLRDDFDSTPHDERDELEIEHWWMKPYIVCVHYQVPDKSYQDYVKRMSTYSGINIESSVDYAARVEANKALWLKAWPSGTRYEVRILDGGSWDRATCLGMYRSLDEAIDGAKSPDKMMNYEQMLERVLKA